ncbi:hypothetical protein MMC10_003118 [Thelotrema lepadinum]|nr:hypothetical protein [Thelotrema lepadinum]
MHRTTRSLSKVLRSAKRLDKSLQDAAAYRSPEARSPEDFLPSRPRGAAPLPSAALDLPLLPEQRKPRDQNITVDSMDETIAAHQEANLTRLFHKHETQGLLDHPLAKERAISRGLTANLVDSQPRTEVSAPQLERPPSVRLQKMPSGGQKRDTSLYHGKFVTPYERLRRLDCVCSGEERLNREIRAFEEYLRPTRTEIRSVEHCIQVVHKVASQVLPGKRLAVHGSRDTGLAGPLSDIDFNIENSDSENGAEAVTSLSDASYIQGGERALKHLRRGLERDRSFDCLNIIKGKNRLVVLEGRHRGSGLDIDIVQRRKEYGGEFAKRYQAQYPQLRPLHVLLSQFLKNVGFNSYNGGIGSYGLYTMILTALTHAREHFEAEELGRQLLHVLDFWARANLLEDGYAADPPCIFSKYGPYSTSNSYHGSDGIKFLIKYNRQQLKGGTHLYRLCLQDPANPFNDVGRSARKVRDIQDHFRKAFDGINHAVQTWDRHTAEERSNVADPMILLRDLLDTDWRNFCEARDKLQRGSPSWI